MKIKKVEIQAFKSYLEKEDGTFDFTCNTSSEPANFVSLFAPNGFGKTSFFDAIDFAITKKISRYVRNDRLKKINLEESKQYNSQEESQLVIRNKNAPKKLPTRVEVTTNNAEKNFISSYKKGIKGSSDFRIQSKSTANNYFESSMLYQESIDSFLRETDSEARFKKFSEIDTELVDINSARSALLSMKSDLLRKQQEINSEKTRLSTEIELNNTNSSYALTVNQLLEDVNERLPERKIDDVQSPFTDFEYLKLSARLEEVETVINDNIESNRKKVLDINTKLSQLHLAKSRYNQYVDSTIQRELILKSISYLDNVKSISRTILKLEQDLNSNQDHLDKLTDLQSKVDSYCAHNFAYNKTANELKDLKSKLISNEKLIITLRDTLSKKIIVQQSISNKIDSLDKEKSNLDAVFNDLDNKSKKLSILESNLKKSDSDIKEFSSNRRDLSQCLVDVNILNLLDFKWTFSNDAIDSMHKIELTSIYEKHSRLSEDMSVLNKKIEQGNLEIKDINQQQSDINFLIDKARNIVTKTKQSHCPLCERKNDSYDELIKRISNNSMLSDMEKSKNSLKTSLMKESSQLSNEIEVLEIDFLKAKNLILTKLKEKLTGLDETIVNESQKRAEFDDSKNNLTSDLDRLKSSVMLMTKDSYLEHLNSLIFSENIRKDAVSKEVEALKETVDSSSEQLELNNKIIELEKKRSIILMDLSRYTAHSDFIKVNKLPLNSDKNQITSFINLKIENLKGTQQGLKNEIGQLKENAGSIEVKNNESIYKNFTKEQSEKEIQVLEGKISSLSKDNHWFINIVNTFINEVYDESKTPLKVRDYLESNLVSLEVNNKHHIDFLAKLSAINETASKIKNYADTTTLKAELRNASNKLIKLQDVIIELDFDIGKLGSEIKSRVDHFFNTDLINKIYQSIDPHPEYKKIIFNCTPEDKPKLLISAQSEKSDKLMSPTLSFSSAQINVLALSIFLARALSIKDDDGNPVDCILIDDPVQSIDAINTLGLIDTLRMISVKFDKQIIVTTHDENFHELLKKKLPDDLFSSKFLRLKAFGKVSSDT
ncbi:hypothetical protein [Aliivibrio sifiae]|uniref:Uncharacterized protein n=1 Tax=Aliivibrio sifiae TaxID=566293 RepID=A0A2S7XDC2_9GAMM|nr:hypothetical protein [Aliivibrio sifiae]PQJ89361.1 hypothetical protein BTO22_07070 [Aliivibrio sifiae]